MTRYFEIIGGGNDPFVTAVMAITDNDQSQYFYILREHAGSTLGEISENQFHEYGDNSWIIPKSKRRFKIHVSYKLVDA